jgi:diacylglycerol kinase (ATP)
MFKEMFKKQPEFRAAIPPGKAQIVINPESGGKSFREKEKMAAAAGARLEQLGWELLDTVTTERPEHATQLAKEAVEQEANVIFVVGGDGTVREMLDPLADKDTAVAMIPAGGQNLWVKENGIPGDPVKAVDLQLAGDIESMDIGRMNGEPFRLVAGIGFDGKVIYAAHGEQRPNVRRPATSRIQYAWLTNRMFKESTATNTTITVDNEPFSEEPLFFGWIGNTNLRSNTLTHMRLGQGKINDGIMEGTFFGKESRTQFARATLEAGARYLLNLDAKRFPFGTYTQGSTFTINTEHPVYGHIDGSPLPGEPTTIFDIKTYPKALKVLKPPN